MSVHSANLLLTGYTDVLALRFSYEHASGKCDVAVTLAADRQCTKRLELECRDVHALALDRFGGGLTQLLCLRVKSVAGDGRDRVRFVVEDLERQALRFECDDLFIEVDGHRLSVSP